MPALYYAQSNLLEITTHSSHIIVTIVVTHTTIITPKNIKLECSVPLSDRLTCCSHLSKVFANGWLSNTVESLRLWSRSGGLYSIDLEFTHQQKLLYASWASHASDAQDAQNVNRYSGRDVGRTSRPDAIPYLPLRPWRPDDVHHQAHASRCPQTLSSPASRRSPSSASLVMAESNSTLASGRLSGCLVFRMLHSDIWTPSVSIAMSGYRLPMPSK